MPVLSAELTGDEATLLELTALAAANEGLEVTKWWHNKAVMRRYLDCGSGVLETIPFLTRTLAWRAAHGVDTLNTNAMACADERSFRKQLLYHLASTDDGRPLLIQRVGAWDISALTVAIQDEHRRTAMRRSHILVSEAMRHTADARALTDGPCANAVLIFDLEEMGLRHLGAQTIFQFLGELFKDDLDHFPNIIGSIVVVNAPRTFSALWAIISRMLHPSTAAKLVVFSYAAGMESKAKLRELCGAARLPAELGGDQEGAPPYHFPCAEEPVHQ